ncbi:hypothetical protein QOT17_001630 [Balamuthia mandrillaris]
MAKRRRKLCDRLESATKRLVSRNEELKEMIAAKGPPEETDLTALQALLDTVRESRKRAERERQVIVEKLKWRSMSSQEGQQNISKQLDEEVQRLKEQFGKESRTVSLLYWVMLLVSLLCFLYLVVVLSNDDLRY